MLMNDKLKLAVLGAAFAAIVSSSNAQQEPMGGHELGMMGKSQRLVQSGNLDQNERSLESAQYRLKQQNKLIARLEKRVKELEQKLAACEAEKQKSARRK